MKLVDSDPVADYEARISDACKLLPAWFVPRMMDDCWSFGLMLTTGVIVGIESIDNVHQAADGSLWIDATMHDDAARVFNAPHNLFVAPTSRTKISINAANIVAAFELADT